MSGIVMILSVHVVIDQQIPAATSYLRIIQTTVSTKEIISNENLMQKFKLLYPKIFQAFEFSMYSFKRGIR